MLTLNKLYQVHGSLNDRSHNVGQLVIEADPSTRTHDSDADIKHHIYLFMIIQQIHLLCNTFRWNICFAFQQEPVNCKVSSTMHQTEDLWIYDSGYSADQTWYYNCRWLKDIYTKKKEAHFMHYSALCHSIVITYPARTQNPRM